MKDFQDMNCKGCYFADPDTVGTGEPCCTYPGKLEKIMGRCQQRRPQPEKAKGGRETKRYKVLLTAEEIEAAVARSMGAREQRPLVLVGKDIARDAQRKLLALLEEKCQCKQHKQYPDRLVKWRDCAEGRAEIGRLLNLTPAKGGPRYLSETDIVQIVKENEGATPLQLMDLCGYARSTNLQDTRLGRYLKQVSLPA